MTKVLNDTDQLTFILTSYGLRRVAEALSNPNEDLNISKIKVGDANFEYYEPDEEQPDLVHPIPDGSFYIVEKELLEDGLTVSFHAVIPETFQNQEIREVGIYETVDEVDKLFAISTQQPVLKPLISLNYLVSINYYAFLKSQNLAAVYDQIVLNPDTQLVTQEDLEKLMSTILFTESNLMEQINGNTRVIGLGRVEQLQAKVDQDKVNFGYLASYNNYTNLLNFTRTENIKGYWLFNYPRRVNTSSSVIDIGPLGLNFSTNLLITNYPRVYHGSMPMLNFATPNYFEFNLDPYTDVEKNPFDFVEDNKDVPFTMLFALNPLSYNTTRTLLTRNSVFEVQELSDNSLQIKLYSWNELNQYKNNYVVFNSTANTIPNSPHSIAFSYNPNASEKVTTYISGRKVGMNMSTTGTYVHMNNLNTNHAGLKSYILSGGYYTQHIDSEVGVIGIMKGALTSDELRAVAFNLEATMGNNPCVKTF